MSHVQPPFSAPPPPPPPAPEPQASRPAPWAWAFVVAAVIGIVGGIMPWFQPTVDGHQIPGASQVHSWNDGRIGIVGPVLMLVAGIQWAMLLGGRSAWRRRNPVNPLRSQSTFSLIAGALALVLLVVAWALVPHNYKDWDEAQQQAHELGLSIGRGPLPGYWLVAVAGVAFVVLGAAGLVQFRRQATPAAPAAPAAPTVSPQPYQQQPSHESPYQQPQAQPYPQQGNPQPGYTQPGYQPGYTQPGHQPGYQQPGYQQPGYESSGYQPPEPYDPSRPAG